MNKPRGVRCRQPLVCREVYSRAGAVAECCFPGLGFRVGAHAAGPPTVDAFDTLCPFKERRNWSAAAAQLMGLEIVSANR